MSGDGDNSDTEVMVATAALVVSVIAFTATLMQCLQQYYASARGYSQCNERVIGEWAKTKSRQFSFEELRFEVQFDAPVIFLCPPTNKKGPVPGADLHILDGTDDSLANSWTTLDMNQRTGNEKTGKTGKERIHTSDNERASWTILLSAIQRMEHDSRVWHNNEFRYNNPDKPPQEVFSDHGLPLEPPSLHSSHTLVVALQRKRRSWDTMPATITRPYATTTMCHLVEMMASMGIYWKEFNRRIDRYRAEGNGFMVLGERFSDLGLMFNFQVNGLWRFEKNRVIPVDEIKELCFGWVPTIYRSTQDKRRLEVPIDLLDLSSLQMATKSEIAETLVMIGCNNYAVSNYLEEGRRTSHLFPISFEILGMLSQVFHIEDTYFTYIPNPTPDRWDSRSVSLVRMMASFQQFFLQDLPDGQRNKRILDQLNNHMDDILGHQEDTSTGKLLRFRALHAALDDADEILTGRTKSSRFPPSDPPQQPQVPNADTMRSRIEPLKQRMTTWARFQSSTSPAAGKSTANGTTQGQSQPKKKLPPGLNQENTAQRERREKVQDVLRSHIQQVLRVLNERDEHHGDQVLSVPPRHSRAYTRSRSLSPIPPRLNGAPTMNEVDNAGPDNRQDELMRLYCKRIRKLVVGNADKAADRRASLVSAGRGRRGSDATPVSPRSPILEGVPTAVSPSQTTPHPADGSIELKDITPPAAAESGEPSPSPTDETPEPHNKVLADEMVYHDDIWCTLVFRMICWLMLHNFNKLDVQVPKSELLGSRMPVYVA